MTTLAENFRGGSPVWQVALAAALVVYGAALFVAAEPGGRPIGGSHECDLGGRLAESTCIEAEVLQDYADAHGPEWRRFDVMPARSR